MDSKITALEQVSNCIKEEQNFVLQGGAGSGKTLTIAGKVKFLVEKKGVSPDDILLLSFTRKAAEEMHHMNSKEKEKEKDSVEQMKNALEQQIEKHRENHQKQLATLQANAAKLLEKFSDSLEKTLGSTEEDK